jgi:transcription elongation factor Elf1
MVRKGGQQSGKTMAMYEEIFRKRVELAPTIDAVPVVHGRWKHYHKQNIAVCTNCSFERDLSVNFGKAVSCPNCGARMDLEVPDGKT